MKKLKIIAVIFLLSFIFVGCSKESNQYLVDINYKEFMEKRNNKETFFIEIVQDGCINCTSFTPKLKEVLAEYQVTGYSLNITNMTEEDYKEFDLEFNISGTPTIIFLTEGEEISKMQRLVGNQSKTKIVSKLKANGYIETENN